MSQKFIALLQRVLDSGVLSFESDAPEGLEELEADICEALKPFPDFSMINIVRMPPAEYDEP